MKRTVIRLIAAFGLVLLGPVAAWGFPQEADEPATEPAEESVPEIEETAGPPSPWAARKYALGLGYSGSTVNFDVPRDGTSEFTFRGWGLVGRIGLSERWGLQFGYRNMDDHESLNTGEEISLNLITAHAYWVWLETKNSRWHVKFGLSWMDFESRIPSVGTSTDHALGPSVGTGFEWGTPKYAFFVDFGLTFADIELIPGVEESLLVGNTISGFIYKF